MSETVADAMVDEHHVPVPQLRVEAMPDGNFRFWLGSIELHPSWVMAWRQNRILKEGGDGVFFTYEAIGKSTTDLYLKLPGAPNLILGDEEE